MGDGIKEGLDISIQHNLIALASILKHSFNGHMAIAAFYEAVGIMMKHRFEDRADQSSYDFLSHPASNRGNAKRAKFPLSLGDIYPFEWDGLIRAGLEVSHEGIKILFEIFLKHLDRDLIETGSAPVSFDGFKSLPHHLRGNSPGKGMDFKFLRHYFHC